MGVFESMSYFLAHPLLAQIAQIATKQVGYFNLGLFATSSSKKIISQIHVNWAIFYTSKGERGKVE
jgi:hypothetical protein